MISSDSLKVIPIVSEHSAGDLVAGRYQLIRKVGSGGMGSVWYAQDLSLDAFCAIKLIDGEKARDQGIRLRFEREAKASAQLRSPHVVNVFDYGEWNHTQYLAMEFLDGEDLAVRLMRYGRLDFESTYRVIAHVARALMDAHGIGIVHRDLKPENIFLVQNYDEEIAKVLDFGIAQHNAYSLKDRATREGAFLGTPCYVSPEQARGRQIDHRSDLWSLGVIAFQCLTGRLPFEANALGELMGQILYEPLPVPSQCCADLPAEFDAWWLKAASRNRDLRFSSAKEMSDQLGVALGIHSIVVVPTIPPRARPSFPPSNEYSGVITAAGIPASANRTTAPAGEQETSSFRRGGHPRQPADSAVELEYSYVDEHTEGTAKDIDDYISEIAAEPMFTASVPGKRSALSMPPPAPSAKRTVLGMGNGANAGGPRDLALFDSDGASQFSSASDARATLRRPGAALAWYAQRGLMMVRQAVQERRYGLLAVIAGGTISLVGLLAWALLTRHPEPPVATAVSGDESTPIHAHRAVDHPAAPAAVSTATPVEPVNINSLPLVLPSVSRGPGDAMQRGQDVDAPNPNKRVEPTSKQKAKSEPSRDYGI